jgi:hypothetical protein
MKNLFVVLVLFFQATLFMGCLEMEPLVPQPQVDENGLTEEITNLVPEYILETMDSLGMSINGGANPPSLEGTFLGDPLVLLSSNRPDDYPGALFAPVYLTFSEQNNSEMTVKVDYQNGPSIGEGAGAYIVGDACGFSVFVEIDVTHTNGLEATHIQVMSGCLEEDGIHDFYTAIFMIDNNGNPSGTWIENGEGRVIYDEDGLSERINEVDDGLQIESSLNMVSISNPNQ